MTWQDSALKGSLEAGNAHRPLPRCSGALLGACLAPRGSSRARQSPPEMKEERKQSKKVQWPSFEGGRAKRPGAKVRGERSVRVGRHRESGRQRLKSWSGFTLTPFTPRRSHTGSPSTRKKLHSFSYSSRSSTLRVMNFLWEHKTKANT